MKIIFNPSNSYQVFHFVEEVEVIIVQTTVEETNGSSSEYIQ